MRVPVNHPQGQTLPVALPTKQPKPATPPQANQTRPKSQSIIPIPPIPVQNPAQTTETCTNTAGQPNTPQIKVHHSNPAHPSSKFCPLSERKGTRASEARSQGYARGKAEATKPLRPQPSRSLQTSPTRDNVFASQLTQPPTG